MGYGREGQFVQQHEQHVPGYEFHQSSEVFGRKLLELRTAIVKREGSGVDPCLKVLQPGRGHGSSR
jgi:hypothetical protein